MDLKKRFAIVAGFTVIPALLPFAATKILEPDPSFAQVFANIVTQRVQAASAMNDRLAPQFRAQIPVVDITDVREEARRQVSRESEIRAERNLEAGGALGLAGFLLSLVATTIRRKNEPDNKPQP